MKSRSCSLGLGDGFCKINHSGHTTYSVLWQWNQFDTKKRTRAPKCVKPRIWLAWEVLFYGEWWISAHKTFEISTLIVSVQLKNHWIRSEKRWEKRQAGATEIITLFLAVFYRLSSNSNLVNFQKVESVMRNIKTVEFAQKNVFQKDFPKNGRLCYDDCYNLTYYIHHKYFGIAVPDQSWSFLVTN